MRVLPAKGLSGTHFVYLGQHCAGDRRAITETDKAVLQLKTQRRQLTSQKTRVPA